MQVIHPSSRQRLRTDFRFAVVTWFSAVAIAGILPFAVYRFASGNPLAGTIDLAIVAFILACVTYAWRGGDAERVGLLMVAGCTAGCMAIAMLTGLPGVLWTYPVLLADYLLVSRWRALLMSFVTVGLTILVDEDLRPGLEMITYATTTSVVSVFAYIFAHRTERQRERLQALATRDPLTGAFNRRAMDHELDLAVEAHRRHGTAFAIALLDLDEFKRINDRYGHEAGDQVLVALVDLLESHFRKLDRVYRLGGEEFVVLLSAAEAAALVAVCEAFRARVERELRYAEESITVSIGAAALQPSQTARQWLGDADAAMYRAKRNGRNRVEIAEGGSALEPSGVEPGASGLPPRK